MRRKNALFLNMSKVSRHRFLLMLTLSAATFMSFTTWQPDYETARKTAAARHQLILLNFSGSDWCGPCIRLKREIFSTDVFSKMADSSLVLFNADFPRAKKHQLSPGEKEENNLLADKFNPTGIFPLTLLIDENGRIVKRWEGLPDMDSTSFTQKVKAICEAAK